MLDALWKRHSQAHLRMLLHNTSPLGNQAQPRIFSQKSLREAKAQGHLRSIMSDGFQNPVQARLRRDLKAQRQLGLPKGFEMLDEICCKDAIEWFLEKVD